MPKIVDHGERRAKVAEAVWRAIERRGVEGATVREIARAAGWSTGVIAHYFPDKKRLLVYALREANRRTAARMSPHLRAADPRAALRAVVCEALPLDEKRRTEWRVWLYFWGRAAGDPMLAAEQVRRYEEWRALIRQVIARIRRERATGPGLDCAAESDTLIALIDGIGLQATLEPGRLPPKRQLELIDRHLGRIMDRPEPHRP